MYTQNLTFDGGPADEVVTQQRQLQLATVQRRRYVGHAGRLDNVSAATALEDKPLGIT